MSKAQTKYLKDYKKPAYAIKTVDLTFELFEEETIVTNSMQITKADTNEKDLKLDAVSLELLEVSLNGLKLQESRYIIEEENLTIINVPTEFEIKIKNKIYPQNNTELEGLYKSGDIFCTQNEPEGFRSITPYLDRPDIMSVFTTTVVADKKKYPILLSNGNKIKCHESFDERHGVTWHDPHPKPSYLFALVAGDLGSISDEFVTMSGNKIVLNIYCDLGNENKCHHAMRSLKEAMKWDEKKYGREYDLEIYNIVAVDSFNMGAMENKGLNIFNSAYVLADMDTATDANFMGIESVIAHEYFHNWTGNRITCRDWFQLTLKEGLTVFRDQCFSADMNSAEVQRIEDVKALRERQFVEDASPTRHPIQPESYISMNNFYTATVYEKGAEVIRMVHTFLGEKKYAKATDLYFETFDGQAVTTDDFLWAMSKGGDINLEAFKTWYHQSGTPRLKVEESFANGTYKLSLTQIIPDTLEDRKQKPYYYPLKMGLLDEEGKEVLVKTLIVSKEHETFVFENFETKPVLSINRDFSAPIIIEQKKSEYDFLMQYDTNSFTQYEATQNFALQTINKLISSDEIDKAFVQAYGYLLDLDVDLSYKALLLELPSVSAIMQLQEKIDFDVIYTAQDKLLKIIAQKFKNKLLDIYKKNHFPASMSLDAEYIAKRAIKNRVLKILFALKSDEVAQLAQKQYEESLTMTDRIVALDVLENLHVNYAEVALQDFYNKYKDETLVMNKYFAILASSSRYDVLERVEKLQRDKVYDEKVPNLVRSLVGSFARNHKYFHAKDGSGYKFLADKIIAIDKINPQMASGLCGAFKVCNKMNNHNQNLMKKELSRVISTQGLSKNSFEIIDKILK
ncbi:aminopeptidase N [Sulfurimonas autotrophica]|uniref:Aminopeptidase N n=1 Tax=Sulfurimonas autotrophica (strain ATCC BAA-671 / DSM 16294 / JCM 11897 / OK10) TaxID=563040 RepID=E0UV09_SULAO|nr:aminopeptidase N [Sulfurimonas autotrophica]ADN09591.1 aminopeptidase N [Sulfurimonas autotrophica DSM 16294]